MPEKTSYAHGTPSWVDLGTTDLADAKRFYGAVFGWEFDDMGPEAGSYNMVLLRGKPIAGMAPSQDPNIPPVWNTFISVDDADKTAALIGERGGTVLMGVMDVMGKGRMLVATDPAGAVFGCWQPQDHPGAFIVNEHGTFCWNELMSRDAAAARDFYTSVFGLGTEDMPMDDGSNYTMLKVGDDTVAGLMPMPKEVPAEAPSVWMTYFAVDDADRAVAQVKDAGGTLIDGPTDSPYGRWALVEDPQGAKFCVIKMPAAAS